MKKHIPNFITSLNVASGFLGIVSAMAGELVWASYLVFAAMFFDYIDGFVARLLSAKSEVGKELDSLGDVVSFGVAPAVILIRIIAGLYGINSFDEFLQADLVQKVMVILPVLLPVFAALRLARFNVYQSNSSDFTGMPVPSVALFFISFPLVLQYDRDGMFYGLFTSPVFYSVTIPLFSYLMVSNLGMFSFKLKRGESDKNSNTVYQLLLLFFGLILAFSFRFQSVPLIILTYVLLSIVRQTIKK